MTDETAVAVIGDGAAGVLTVTALLARAAGTGAPLRVEWIGDGHRGRGVAYASAAPWHRLNVPAAGMSVGDADDFPRWLADHGAGGDADPRHGNDFARRHDYGSYLLDRLAAARAAAGTAVLAEHRGRATSLAVDPDGVRVRVGADPVHADRAVLATGVPTFLPLPHLTAAAAAHPGLIADPWDGPLEEITHEESVLLVGTGLTMIDVALTLARRLPALRLRAVSRSGLLPHRHLRDRAEPGPPAIVPRPGLTLDEIVDAVQARVAEAPERWREVVDGLRPVTQALWRTLSHADQQRFLREHERRWMRHRHRVAPVVAEEIDALRRSGRLRLSAATVEEIDAPEIGGAAGRLRVTLRNRAGVTEVVEPDRLIGGTGLQYDLRRATDPLFVSLLRDGLARPHPLRLGLDTAPDGAVQTDAGPSQRLFTLGSLRRGDLYETIGLAEIAEQAAALAERLVTPVGPRAAG